MKDFIYMHSFKMAQERGETELYRESAVKNRACLAAIDKAISASNYEPNHYNLSAALESVTKDYSVDRVAYLMAGLVQAHDSDGRYSRENKAWAQNFEVADTRDIVLNSHPILLDGFADKVREAQEKLLARAAGEEKENPLKAAEMSSEQNYNQIDGIINNEIPRSNQGYVITDSEVIGNIEIVLAESPTAPSPFVTWQRNIENDELDGRENFFWGHYFTNPEPAQDDFKRRVADAREDFLETHPSIRAQLKENAAQCVKQSAAPKKDPQER